MTAGTDFGLAVVAELVGQTEAGEGAAGVVAAVRERLAAIRTAREPIIDRLAQS